MDELISSSLDKADQLGLVGFMFLAFVGLIRGWWVPGHVYRKAIESADHWRAIALRGTTLAERHAGIPVDQQLDQMFGGD